MAEKRPLVDANLMSEFGGIESSDAFNDYASDGHGNYLYVPGFSEMRVRRDTDLKRLADHEIKAKEVSTLPVNVRWFRAVKGAGSDPDHKRTVQAKNAGYRPVTSADQGADWMKDLPPNAIVAADGTIRSSGGDLTLHVIDQQGAARNALRKKRIAEEMVDGMEMRVDENGVGLGVTGKAHKGAEPFVDKRFGEVLK